MVKSALVLYQKFNVTRSTICVESFIPLSKLYTCTLMVAPFGFVIYNTNTYMYFPIDRQDGLMNCQYLISAIRKFIHAQLYAVDCVPSYQKSLLRLVNIEIPFNPFQSFVHLFECSPSLVELIYLRTVTVRWYTVYSLQSGINELEHYTYQILAIH